MTADFTENWLNVGCRVMHCSSLVHDRITSASLVWFWANTDAFRLHLDADSVLILSACPTSRDETCHPMVSIKIIYIQTSPLKSSLPVLFPLYRWDRGDGRISFNFCWNTWKNSDWLHKKLDQVPRLHVNVFLSRPDSAQGPLHHVTFLHRKKDVGIFYLSRDSSLWKPHLFSL